VLLAILLAIVFSLVWPSHFGSAFARVEYALGIHEVKQWGCPAPWAGRFDRLLHERYGVGINTGGSHLDHWHFEYATGYNSTLRGLLRRDFGRDVFRECLDDARTEWEAEHPRRD
jgi:hypothetical protein